jgi:ABC-type branched-subunit amino acid transport system ATPase component
MRTPLPSTKERQESISSSGMACKNIEKSFDGTRALVDVSIQFPKAGIIALVGPNGAGKTTLLNVLTGFLRPDSGHCWMNGEDITLLPPYQVVQHGIVRSFQEVRLVRQISVLENVLLACPQQRGEDFPRALLRFGLASEKVRNRTVAQKWLRFFNLEGNASVLAGDLSYGQQKLVSLACCLATGAKVVLLDEPVAGLDPEMVRVIVELLRSLRQTGCLIVFVEHNLATVREVANEVIVMDQGKIIARGPPDEVLELRAIMDAFVG